MKRIKNKEIVIFDGPSGIGKGVQAEEAVRILNYMHISTGQLCRDEVASKTEIGLAIKDSMDAGILTDDKTMFFLVQQALRRAGEKIKGFILDGFPRTEEQAKWLLTFLEDEPITIKAVVIFRLSDKECLRRLKGRAKDAKKLKQQRSDDTQKVHKNRLKVYKEQTAPVREIYKLAGLHLIELDASPSIDVIHNNLMKQLHSTVKEKVVKKPRSIPRKKV